MLDLAPETEALARRLGEARGLTVDATVRSALETFERSTRRTEDEIERDPSAGSALRSKHSAKRDISPEAIARRRESLERIQREIAALPDLDPRSSKEIMDDLDPL